MKKIAFNKNEYWSIIIAVQRKYIADLVKALIDEFDLNFLESEDSILINSMLLDDDGINKIKKFASDWIEENWKNEINSMLLDNDGINEIKKFASDWIEENWKNE